MADKVPRGPAEAIDDLVRRRKLDAFQPTPGETEVAAQDEVVRRLEANPAGLGEAVAGQDQATREQALTQLQQRYGNRAVQRLLQRTGAASGMVQRDATPPTSPGWTFSPLNPAAPSPNGPLGPVDPALSKVVAQEAKERDLVFGWLDQHVAEVNLWAGGLQQMDLLVAKVRQGAAGTEQISDSRIRRYVLDWARQHNVKPLPGTSGTGDVLRERVEAAVQSALGLAAEGVSVTLVERKDPTGGNKITFEVNVSVQGATAKLKVGGTELSGTVAYDKGVKAQLGNDDLNFSAELAPDKWSLKLNIGLDPEVPELGSIGDVFGKAQRGLSELASHPEKQSESDVAAAMRDAGDAFDALQAIAKAPRLSASIGVGSPDSGPPSAGGGPAIPKGWQITVTVTGRF